MGDTDIGRTSVYRRLANIHLEKFSMASVDFAFRTVEREGIPITLQFWDIAGSTEFRGMQRVYFRGAKGVFLVYSVSSRSSFDDINSWVGDVTGEAGEDCKMVLLGHIQDDSFYRAVSTEEGESLAESMCVPFFEVCAKTGENIEEALNALVDLITQDTEPFSVKTSDPQPSNDNTDNESPSGCSVS